MAYQNTDTLTTHFTEKTVSAFKRSYQVCYDVMVTFHMFPHTDSLERKKRERLSNTERGREREREQKHIISLLSTDNACIVVNQRI